MFTPKLLLQVLATFLVISCISSASTKKNYGDFKDVDVRGMYVYSVSCKEYTGKNASMPCRILRESKYEKNGTKFCDLVLKGRHVKNLQTLSRDLVALSWYAHYKDDLYKFTTSVVNLTNCNNFGATINHALDLYELEYTDAFRLATTFTSGNDKFHTLFNIPDACNATLCEMTFDAQGKQVKVSDFHKNVVNQLSMIYDVKPLNFAKESYLVNQIHPSFQYLLLTPGDVKVLMEYSVNSSNALSLTHKTIRLCREDVGNIINCATFDVSGRTLSNVSIKLSHSVSGMEVENLSNGEFLLFTQTKNLRRSYVTKVGGNGKTVGKFELTELPKCGGSLFCEERGDLRIVNNKYCRFVIRRWIGGFKYGRKCFGDDVFE